LKTLQQRK